MNIKITDETLAILRGKRSSEFCLFQKEQAVNIELKNPLLVNGVRGIIAKTLEKDPGKRFKNVKELLDVMEDFKSTCLRVLQ